MGKLLHAEWYKLLHDKNFGALSIAVVLFNMIMLSGTSVWDLSGQSALTESMKKEIATVLLACIYGGISLGSDFADRTMYHGLLTGRSRSSVLIAKAIVFTAAANFLLFLFPFLLTLFCSLKNGWGKAISTGHLLHGTGVAGSLLLLGCAISALPLLSAVCFRDIGRTIGIPVVLYFVMVLLLNSSHAAAWSKILPIGLLILTADGTVPPAYGILAGALWFAWLTAISAFVFRRAELR